MIDQHNSLSEKFLKKGFWLYLFSFIIGPMWYIIKIIVSSELTVSEIWILYWVISLISLVSAFNDFGMTESLNHFLPDFITKNRYDKVKSILVYTIIAQLTTWIIIASFFFFWADAIAANYFKSSEAAWILKVFALYFLWISIFQINSTFFMAIQNTFYSKLIDFFRTIFTLASTLIIFFLNLWNLVHYSYSWIIWLYLWILIALTFFYKKYYKKYLINEKIIWSKKLFSKVFKYAILVLLWAQAATILGQMDMQIIIYMLGTKDAGYYTNYLSLISIPFLIIAPGFWLLFPMFSEMHSKLEHKKIKLVKEIFTKNFLLIWIAFNVLFFVFAENIAYVLFWEKFIISWIILRYSILFLTFNFLLQINWSILAWIWKVKEKVKIISIGIVFNFFTNIILINMIWVYWSALATWIWWVIIRVLWEYYLWKDYIVNFDYKLIIKNVFFITFVWTFCYFFIIPLLQWLSRWKSLLVLSIVSIIYFWIFILFNYNNFKFFILAIKKIKSNKNNLWKEWIEQIIE